VVIAVLEKHGEENRHFEEIYERIGADGADTRQET
jgi:carbonic anhydrase